MFFRPTLLFILTLLGLAFMINSCQKSNVKAYKAYFGGEVTNPTNDYILFCKDSKVIDSVKLDDNNRFMIHFDSLSPGMYTFKNEPEYQYVYFDKNDSLMVHINSKDFDNSIIFCGRGDQKNNFLIDLYLKNEADKNSMFPVFEYPIEKFNKVIDSTFASQTKFYKESKAEIKWNDAFDIFAKAALDLPYYSKKEIYPKVHLMRTGEDVFEKIPKDYYSFRKSVDYSNSILSFFSPYIIYIQNMLNNSSAINYHHHLSDIDLALKTNVHKLQIADTLIKNENLKNIILNNIAFTYLLEDQNMINNKLFLETYNKFSTDKSQKNEIIKIGNAINSLSVGNTLPEIELIDRGGKKISTFALAKKKTVFFFWTEKLTSHLEASHRKLLALKSKFPDYQFIAINLDKDQNQWIKTLSQYKFDGIEEYRSIDFEDIKCKWAITKVNRTIVLDKNGKIKNAFVNVFEVNFEDKLK